MKLLNPLTLAKLSKIQIKIKYVVEGVLSGLHSSRFKGHSLEFAQHREYSFGDELRHIDWKVFGRSEKFFVKQFQDETNLRAYILLDASGSMNFKSKKNLSKLTYASYLAGSAAYLLLNQSDAAGLGIFDDKLRLYIPPNHQLSHLSLIFDSLEKIQAGGESKISDLIKDFGSHVKRRSLIIIISDLLDDPEKIISAMKYFRFRHHEVIVLHVLDSEEIDFNYNGENVFIHMENNSELAADLNDIGDEYRKIFKNFLYKYKFGFLSCGINYHLITTDTPLEIALSRCSF